MPAPTSQSILPCRCIATPPSRLERSARARACTARHEQSAGFSKIRHDLNFLSVKRFLLHLPPPPRPCSSLHPHLPRHASSPRIRSPSTSSTYSRHAYSRKKNKLDPPRALFQEWGAEFSLVERAFAPRPQFLMPRPRLVSGKSLPTVCGPRRNLLFAPALELLLASAARKLQYSPEHRYPPVVPAPFKIPPPSIDAVTQTLCNRPAHAGPRKALCARRPQWCAQHYSALRFPRYLRIALEASLSSSW